MEKALGRLGLMADVLLMADPRVARVPLQDCREPLVDLHAIASLRVDDRKRDPQGHFARLRRGVASRLDQATTLLPDGLGLLIVEGYRPPQLQLRYFTGYRRKLADAHPDLSDTQLDAAASRYVSPPAVAPHCAGAAVDLTLCTSDGHELDMGTRVDATPEDSDGGCYTDAENISANRPGQPRHPDPRPADGRPGQLPHRVVALVLRRPLLGDHHRRPSRLLRAHRAIAIEPVGAQSGVALGDR